MTSTATGLATRSVPGRKGDDEIGTATVPLVQLLDVLGD